MNDLKRSTEILYKILYDFEIEIICNKTEIMIATKEKNDQQINLDGHKLNQQNALRAILKSIHNNPT